MYISQIRISDMYISQIQYFMISEIEFVISKIEFVISILELMISLIQLQISQKEFVICTYPKFEFLICIYQNSNTDMYISLIPEFRICTYQKLNL
jgi:hypothetical protein